MRIITNEQIEAFRVYLLNEEKALATIRKYIRDLREFLSWLPETAIDKSIVLSYKSHLIERYAPASVNAALSSLNSFFNFMEWFELRVKNLKIQRQIFASTDIELSKAEYERLLQAARRKKNQRTYFLMQTISPCSIRRNLPSL